jgi:hypothetical protein
MFRRFSNRHYQVLETPKHAAFVINVNNNEFGGVRLYIV